MKRALIAMVAVLAAAAPSFSAPVEPAFAGPDLQGPKVPALTDPVAVVTALDSVEFSCAVGGRRDATITVPSVAWNRVIVEFTGVPDGDPWDRLYMIAVGGVEVLHGTTPRTTFTVRKDITEFASLLPPGGTATVSLDSGSYVGRLLETVKLFFYDDATAALVRAPAAAVVPAILWGGLGGAGSHVDATAQFPPTPARSATLEVTLSGHGAAEDWFLNSPGSVTFDVFVDGVDVARVSAMPYTYAFFGFGNANANNACSGPGTSSTGDTVHPVMWWTAQRGLDAAGVHPGIGEIPPYRAEVDPALLTGARTVSIVQNNGPGSWPVSVGFLLR